MGGAFGSVAGGILSLLDLPREQWEALESDLMRVGYTAADVPRRLSWRALKAFVAHVRPGDAFYHQLHGEVAEWSAQEHLTANLIDLVMLLVWFKTSDGQKGRNRPKPVQRPGVNQQSEGVSLGGAGVPVEEFADRWAEAVARQLEAEAAAKEELNSAEQPASD